MKLWTIQTLEKFNKLQQEGCIYGEKEFIDPDYLEAYDWLVDRMAERIGSRPFENCYPVWAWKHWCNQDKPKPDLRSSSHFMKGVKGVRLEIVKQDSDVLLSDFNLWHFPLAYKSYIGDSEADDLTFANHLKSLGFDSMDYPNLPLKYRNSIEESWLKIFDMDYDCEYSAWPYPQKTIQATFWSLSIEEVQKVDFFTAR